MTAVSLAYHLLIHVTDLLVQRTALLDVTAYGQTPHRTQSLAA